MFKLNVKTQKLIKMCWFILYNSHIAKGTKVDRLLAIYIFLFINLYVA